MKKVINENTIKAIVRESLKNYLQESMSMTETDGWTPDMDDMWDEFGNNNVHDTEGAFGALAQGDEDEPSEFVSDDNAEYFRGKMLESVINQAVNEAFKKITENEDYDCGWDKTKWCGDAKFHAANEKKTKDTKKSPKKSINDKQNWCGDKKFHSYNEKKNK